MPTHPRPPFQTSVPESLLSPKALLDLYFLDARSKLIDLAAFLDRIERARSAFAGTGDAVSGDDYRLLALKAALKLVSSEGTGKAKGVQLTFSDPTLEPLESAAGMKGASGAWPGRKDEG